jgi:GNAT superfamily N-acetyltransferase
MKMRISFCNRNDKDYQAMLNALLKDIFLDFQFWYDLNLWDENYESYSIIDGGSIVSNICVYKTQILLNYKTYDALSIGAVATKEEYRGRGLSRTLMEHIQEKYKNVPMYLSANDSVSDFYPRFGFRRVYEKLPVCTCRIDNCIPQKRLSHDDPKIRNYVYNRVNLSHRLDCLNSAGINLFHIYLGYLKDKIIDIPELETIAIAELSGETLKLIGVFSLREISFSGL